MSNNNNNTSHLEEESNGTVKQKTTTSFARMTKSATMTSIDGVAGGGGASSSMSAMRVNVSRSESISSLSSEMESFLEMARHNKLTAIRELIDKSKTTVTTTSASALQRFDHFDVNYRGESTFSIFVVVRLIIKTKRKNDHQLATNNSMTNI